MTRCEGLIESIKEGDTNGLPFEKWVLMLVTDIALSLATIADAVTEKDQVKSDDESGSD